jgi:hypothetical protein
MAGSLEVIPCEIICAYDAITKYTNSQSPDNVFNGQEQSIKPGHCDYQPEKSNL